MGRISPYDMLVGVPSHGAPAAVKGTPIAAETGWIPVMQRTFRQR